MKKYLGFIIGICILLGTGCSSKSDFVLKQPAASAAEQTIRLDSGDAWYACSDGVGSLLLQWPLPGSECGKPFYQLYVQVPDSDGTHKISAQNPTVTGLFLQLNGRRAGRTEIIEGTISLEGSGSSDYREGCVRLVCKDGTSIEGIFQASWSTREVSTFERIHAADIATLKDTSHYVQVD